MRRIVASGTFAVLVMFNQTDVIALDTDVFVDNVRLDTNQVCVASKIETGIEVSRESFEDGSSVVTVEWSNGCSSWIGEVVFTVEDGE